MGCRFELNKFDKEEEISYSKSGINTIEPCGSEITPE